MPLYLSLFKLLPQFRVLLVVLLLLVCASGCYYYKQGTTLLAHQFSAKPVMRYMADSSISPKERTFFREIEQIRNFAFDTLGLKKNSNYTRYVAIDSNYLVAVLSVADSTSLVPVQWCYPLFGCFPLRAYHDIADAKKAGERFIQKGYEINIDKVDGFSTLGIFSDPLYSFMADYPVFSLARYIFHEQMHATAYFRNVRFSEEVATYIGNEAALTYMKMRFGDGSAEYCDAVDFMEDQRMWVAMLRNLYSELESVYASPISRQEKIERKVQIVAAFKNRLHTSYDSLFLTEWYRQAEKRSFNNAYLAVRMTYHKDLELFAALQKKRGSLREVVSFVKGLKKVKGDPKEQLIAAIAEGEEDVR